MCFFRKKKKEAKKATTKKEAKKPEEKKSTAKKTEPKKEEKTTGVTCYHVSKRDNDGREWKVFLEGSDKVIKLFATQQEALDYAKGLCKNSGAGSYVKLHGLDGKIRKF